MPICLFSQMASEPPSKKQCNEPNPGMIQYPGEDPAVTRFREFLSIRTVSVKNLDTPGPQPDYGEQLLNYGFKLHMF